jgi:hypothetical protein
VVDSRIDGDFNGWDGETENTLTNGQTWKQAAYKYTYKSAYRPSALVYRGGSGYIMEVKGTRATVRRT